MGLGVLGLEQAGDWGWSSAATWACLGAGLALLALFVRVQLAADEPFVPLRLFADRAFRADDIVLFLLPIRFVPLLFFASLDAQAALGEDASRAGLFLLVFFGGFTIGARRGGRILDTRGARTTVIVGCALAAVGFLPWATKLDGLSFGSQWVFLAMAGAGVGLTLGPVGTDALNRASWTAYGAVTGRHAARAALRRRPPPRRAGTVLITGAVSRVEGHGHQHGRLRDGRRLRRRPRGHAARDGAPARRRAAAPCRRAGTRAAAQAREPASA
jgi:hypothetical protein